MNVIPTGIMADRHLADAVLGMATKAEAPERSYWKMISCRETEGYEGRSARILRMDPTKDWEWKTDPLSQTVKRLVEPFVHHYSHLTRVELLIQKPGEAVYCHKDRITGQIYNGIVSTVGFEEDWEKYGPVCNADPTQHEKQRFFGGRLSLGACGKSYILQSISSRPEKVYYHYDNQFFFLNEDVFHGADAVGFWRGVVFFDGIQNPEVMCRYYDSF